MKSTRKMADLISSVYPSQVFAIMNLSSFPQEIGREVEEMQSEFVLRKKTLIRLMLSLVGRCFRRGG